MAAPAKLCFYCTRDIWTGCSQPYNTSGYQKPIYSPLFSDPRILWDTEISQDSGDKPMRRWLRLRSEANHTPSPIILLTNMQTTSGHGFNSTETPDTVPSSVSLKLGWTSFYRTRHYSLFSARTDSGFPSTCCLGGRGGVQNKYFSSCRDTYIRGKWPNTLPTPVMCVFRLLR